MEYSDVQSAIIDAFTQALQLDHVDPQDDFFELGGDSLAAIEIAATIEEAFKIDFGVEELFEYATPAGLSRRVEELRG